jgi:hypothetical protein
MGDGAAGSIEAIGVGRSSSPSFGDDRPSLPSESPKGRMGRKVQCCAPRSDADDPKKKRLHRERLFKESLLNQQNIQATFMEPVKQPNKAHETLLLADSWLKV